MTTAQVVGSGQGYLAGVAALVARTRSEAIHRAAVRFSRFVEVDQTTGCHLWVGALNSSGYGVFGFGGHGKVMLAHRFAFELARGPIPDGLQLDHLCRSRPCVNEAHLEAVTAKENNRRGESPTALNARRTHCVRGHPFEGGDRHCRKCVAVRTALRAQAATGAP